MDVYFEGKNNNAEINKSGCPKLSDVLQCITKEENKMPTITLRVNSDEEKFFKDYAKLTGEKLSSLLKKALLEKIEDEYDLKMGIEASEEFKENPISYSMDEMRNKYGL